MKDLILYGHPLAPNPRAVRIALIEKGIGFDFPEFSIDYFGSEDYAKLHPFKKMPTLKHGDFILYETPAILGYVDEAFEGISLQPQDHQARAQMRKWLNINSCYFSQEIMKLFFQRIINQIRGGTADERIVAEAAIVIEKNLNFLEAELNGTYLVGNSLSLADILLGVFVSYLNMTKEGFDLIQTHPKTTEWLANLNQRESFSQTLATVLVGEELR